jgi:hypothetical protein
MAMREVVLSDERGVFARELFSPSRTPEEIFEYVRSQWEAYGYELVTLPWTSPRAFPILFTAVHAASHKRSAFTGVIDVIRGPDRGSTLPDHQKAAQEMGILV